MENVNTKNSIVKGNYFFLIGILVIASVFLIAPFASSGVGGTVVTKTSLEVGNVFPEILNISVNSGVPITLTPNATKHVVCQALIQDWNNDTDIDFLNATLYDTTLSTWNGADDMNTHYTNSSCEIISDTQGLFDTPEDDWHALANCSFEVEYFANPGDWNCSVYIEDKTDLSNREEDSGVINTMAAIGVQDVINYGTVDSTKVSNESVVNVTNVGNTMINLTLEGYAITPADGFAMNCSKGSGSKTIAIEYEKYNLTASNTGDLSLSEAEALHVNLTSATSATRQFNLDYRQNEVFNEAVKPTFWRIYVPKGLAGTCEGNIVFGGTVSPAD